MTRLIILVTQGVIFNLSNFWSILIGGEVQPRKVTVKIDSMDHSISTGVASPDVVSDLIIPERNPCKIYVGNLPFAAKVS